MEGGHRCNARSGRGGGDDISCAGQQTPGGAAGDCRTVCRGRSSARSGRVWRPDPGPDIGTQGVASCLTVSRHVGGSSRRCRRQTHGPGSWAAAGPAFSLALLLLLVMGPVATLAADAVTVAGGGGGSGGGSGSTGMGDTGADVCDILPAWSPANPPIAGERVARFQVVARIAAPSPPLLATLQYGDEDGRQRTYTTRAYGQPDAYGRTPYILDRWAGASVYDSTPEASTARLYGKSGWYNVTCRVQDSAGRLATGTRRVYVYAATPRAALGGWPTLLTGPGTGTDAPTPATESLPVTWADPGLPPATFRVLDLQIQDSGLGSGFPYGIVHGYLSARALSPDPAADPGDPDSWSLATTRRVDFVRRQGGDGTTWALAPEDATDPSHPADPNPQPGSAISTFKLRVPGRYRLTWTVPDPQNPDSDTPYASDPEFVELLVRAQDPGYVAPPLAPPPFTPSPPAEPPGLASPPNLYDDSPPPPPPPPASLPSPSPQPPSRPQPPQQPPEGADEPLSQARARPPAPPDLPPPEVSARGGQQGDPSPPPAPPPVRRQPPPSRRPPPRWRRPLPPHRRAGGKVEVSVHVVVEVEVRVRGGRRLAKQEEAQVEEQRQER
ncbi:hypothetical protein CHLRE_04g216774v5 [Chlamydomonas reinhardtii]|uniref:PKD domain-containing protein n=1 Tax=Chlamydomonas reinhardtii TaxID=3055 RepID=A0A2K3DTA3_CHLRE|nr:uncharacterized protein CHLRE_04g216774v5 [Chlamydomonas reinhardtii]PNW83764.1 hypothetical protein CHLRE_04g216774v5 [Chlamydomonas reinhardtii]